MNGDIYKRIWHTLTMPNKFNIFIDFCKVLEQSLEISNDLLDYIIKDTIITGISNFERIDDKQSFYNLVHYLTTKNLLVSEDVLRELMVWKNVDGMKELIKIVI
jgi:hypothetical protein